MWIYSVKEYFLIYNFTLLHNSIEFYGLYSKDRIFFITATANKCTVYIHYILFHVHINVLYKWQLNFGRSWIIIMNVSFFRHIRYCVSKRNREMGRLCPDNFHAVLEFESEILHMGDNHFVASVIRLPFDVFDVLSMWNGCYNILK